MGTKLNKKVYRTIEEQIDYLIKEKNIDPNTINPNYFSLKTYLSLVTPYTELVCIGRDGTENKRHIYKEKTDFSDFIFWNDVDRCLSLKLQDAVGFFEKKLKLFLETKICAMMKTTGDLSCSNYKGFTSYLSGGKFLNFLNIDECEDEKLRIAKISASEYNSRKYAIEKIINLSQYDNRNNTIIKHYKKMGYVPFWVLIHGLTLNELSQLFLMLKYEDKKDFVEELTNKQKIIYRDVKSFSSKLADITTIRNIVNHYEPIIPYILSYDYDKIQILYNSISLLWSNYLKHVDSLLTISVDLDVIAQKENTYNKYKIVRIINILKILK